MGSIGDLLGGKKAPPPPPELREAAEGIIGQARGQAPRTGQLRDASDSFLAGLPPQIAELLLSLDSAQINSLNLGDDFKGLWENYGHEALRRQGEETLAAGSEERQQDVALSRREAVNRATDEGLKAHRQSLFRRGITEGGQVDSPHIAVQRAIGIANAENDARIQERDYGENVRRMFAQTAQGFGDKSVNLPLMGANIGRQKIDANALPANLAARLYGQETAQAGGVSSLFDAASNAFSTNYNADLSKAQSDQNRKASIWGTVAKLGGDAFKAFAGVPPGGGSAAGAGSFNPYAGIGNG